MKEERSSGKINLSDRLIDYELVKIPRRKSLRLRIKSDEILEIRCAKSVKWKTIEEFIVKKERWILKSIQQLSTKIPLKFPDSLDDSTILFKGHEYSVFYIKSNSRQYSYKLESNSFYIYHPIHAKIKNIIRKFKEFYKQILLEIATEILSQLSTKFQPNQLKIRDYKAKWGSANSRKDIYLNTYLLMLPIELIEYVVYHEASHLVEMNHSPKFKQLLSSISPNYSSLKRELKKYTLKSI